jgi:vancomycin aglycone glucosyltransferase
MRVVLTSFGSTGDIYPLIALGRALVEAGHQCVFATAPIYADEIRRGGVEYFPMPPEWEPEIFAEFMRELDRIQLPLLQLREIYRGALPFIPEILDRLDGLVREADVLISSYMFPHFKWVADQHGKAFAVFHFTWNFIPTADVPAEPMPRLRGWPKPLARPFHRLSWGISNWLVDRTVNRVLEPVLKARSMPPMKDFLYRPADLCLVAASPYFAERRGIEDDRFRFVGAIRFQAAEDPELDERIAAFRGDEKVPVLTFGSVTFDNVHGIMRRFVTQWPKHKKIIIQHGWAGLSVEVEQPNFLFVGKVSHDQLFRHASCVIHHGGAGTTASVMHGGVPQIIIPHIADQPFFASEVKRLGIGLRVRKSRWPEQLPRAVRVLHRRKTYAQKARKLAALLHRETGPANAVAALEELVTIRSNRTKRHAREVA